MHDLPLTSAPRGSCWTYETSVLLDTPIADELPYNDFYEYYSPDFKLHLTPSPTIENHNTPEALDVGLPCDCLCVLRCCIRVKEKGIVQFIVPSSIYTVIFIVCGCGWLHELFLRILLSPTPPSHTLPRAGYQDPHSSDPQIRPGRPVGGDGHCASGLGV